MAYDTGRTHALRRSKLPPLLRWAQLALFTLFFADTYVYSILDTLLGRYLGTLGITQEHMSLAYSIYGIAQLVGSIALLLLQSWPAAASMRLPTQYTLIIVTIAAALGSTLLMVLAPASYRLLLVARAIQGTMGAVYTIYAMTLLVQWFPPAWQMQAVAFMTAGQTSGDSLAPVIGAVLYDTRGIVSAFLTQTIIYTATLCVLLVLGVWWAFNRRRQAPTKPLATSVQEVQLGDPCEEQQIEAAVYGAANQSTNTHLHNAGACRTQRSDFANAARSQQPSRGHDQYVSGVLVGKDVEADVAGRSEGSQVAILPLYAPALTAGAQQAQWGDGAPALIGKYVRMAPDTVDVEPQPRSSPPNMSATSQAIDAGAVVIAVTDAGHRQAAECRATSSANTSTHTAPMTVWQMLRRWAVVCECGVVLWAQMLRATLDVIAPLAMYTTPTRVVGLVFLGQATGAFLAPFLLDLLLVRVPHISTRAVQLVAVACMAVSGVLVLLCHLSVPGAAVFFTCFGASHSIVQALVLKHLVDQVRSEENPGVLIARMSCFSLFYITGFTLGAFIAGAPYQNVTIQQQLALAAVAGGMLLYVGVYEVLLRRKCIVGSSSSRP